MATKTLISLFALFLFAAPLAHAGQKDTPECESRQLFKAIKTGELEKILATAVQMAENAARTTTGVPVSYQSGIIGPVAAELISKALDAMPSNEVREILVACQVKPLR